MEPGRFAIEAERRAIVVRNIGRQDCFGCIVEHEKLPFVVDHQHRVIGIAGKIAGKRQVEVARRKACPQQEVVFEDRDILAIAAPAPNA